MSACSHRVRPLMAPGSHGATIGGPPDWRDSMRAAAILVTLAIAACGKEPAKETAPADAAPAPQIAGAVAAPAENTVADFWPEGFPKPAVDYSGEYEIGGGGKTTAVTIAASGAKQRMTLPPGSGIGGSAGQWSQVMVNENAGGKMMMWPEGAGAPAIATTMSKSDLGAMAGAFGVGAEKEASAKRTGTDNVAGEACAIWEFAAGDGETPGSACVTRDGIPLRVISGSETLMLAKSISRGPQDPALFAPPAGYEVVDMGECMRIGAEMMEAMRAGKTPDMAKMKKCEALGQKMGEMYKP